MMTIFEKVVDLQMDFIDMEKWTEREREEERRREKESEGTRGIKTDREG